VKSLPLFAAALVLCLAGTSKSLVRLEEGSQTINGVQLLQDYQDPKRYYYVPTVPRLAQNPDGSFQLLCMKYVDVGGKSSGGLFHALIDFTLPDEAVRDLQSKLQKRMPGAVIMGMVPLVPPDGSSGEATAGFSVVSAILKNQSFTQSTISSGRAPLTPGSRAAIAAILTPPGATLLFDSLTQSASDVSVAVSGTFEAAVVGFSAKITAEYSSVTRHFSEFRNKQSGFTRETLRKEVDDLRKSGVIKVEVLDRSATLTGFKANEMNAIVDVVTTRLSEAIFDQKPGIVPAPAGDDSSISIPGRQEKGFLGTLLTGSGSREYVSDQQFFLKERIEAKQGKFEVLLTKSGTVKVPVYSAGNLRLQHDALKEDPRYFRTVNLADSAFELREVFFQVDPDTASAFNDTINYVTVSMRKTYSDNPETVRQLTFTADKVKNGAAPLSLNYPRLGEPSGKAMDYEYRVTWSLRGREPFSYPSENGWAKSSQHMQVLRPPLEKFEIILESEKSAWLESGIVAVNVMAEIDLRGRTSQKRILMRAQEAESSKVLVIYGDPGAKHKITKTWVFKDGRQVTEVDPVSDAIYLNLRGPKP
jgi:hypothetical protein